MSWFEPNEPRWVNDLRRDHKLILKAVNTVGSTASLILATLDKLQEGRFNYTVGPVVNKPERAVGLGLIAGKPTMKGS